MRGSAILIVGLTVLWAGCGPVEPERSEVNLVVPERAGLFTHATEHYGALQIQETPDDGIDAVADVRPWSGYWYPISDDLLVAPSERNGGQSTLEKYDQFSVKVLGKRTNSVRFEVQSGDYIPSEEIGWQGRCNAWAIASVMVPEPVLPPSGQVIEGLRFFTRDVKALVIKSYESIDERALLRFGQRFGGEPGDDYEDIYPDQFHRVLISELFEKKRPILMDSDAGIQVWNKPIWKSVVRVKKDPVDIHVMHVETALWGVMSETISPDFVGTANKTFVYSYDLFGHPQPDGSLVVQYGRWTGESVKEHPDFLTALPPKGTGIAHSSRNRQIEQATIDDILNRTGALAFLPQTSMMSER